MENTSKALIIAGAVLLAILIIGLGVYIYNQAANNTHNTNFDQVAIQRFNRKFETYEGVREGSKIVDLVNDVISNNYTYAEDDSMKVTINGILPDKPGHYYTSNPSLGQIELDVREGNSYIVDIEKDLTNGIVRNINLTVLGIKNTNDLEEEPETTNNTHSLISFNMIKNGITPIDGKD